MACNPGFFSNQYYRKVRTFFQALCSYDPKTTLMYKEFHWKLSSRMGRKITQHSGALIERKFATFFKDLKLEVKSRICCQLYPVL